MPRYLLDTNMCIYLMKNQPEEVARRFAQCYVCLLYTSRCV